VISVSVVICCYNSSKTISKTLEYLLNQVVDFDWEIVLVNNNSTDNTLDIINGYISRNKIKITIVNEIKSGKSYALLKGVISAQGKYIIICDDDNLLKNNYISLAYSILENNPEIGILGGRGEIYTENKNSIPFWFTSFQNDYAIGVQNIYSGDISARGYLWGAGSAFNRTIFLDFINEGINFKLTCRNGDELTSGGDTEYCCWFLLAGYKLWYDEDLVYYHYITDDRLTKEYLTKLIEGTSSFNTIIATYHQLLQDFNLENTAFKRLKSIIKSSLLLLISTIKWKDFRFTIQRLYPLNRHLVVDSVYHDLYKIFYRLRAKK
jgi:glycosyltransferase involved in cell wall biosynthesis